ncbi:MAG: hypothetical protein KAT34_14125 [Candidatus Aminicenantes bacterium]|nr:hypothetical protein [Candidatus Aminicenantes bacterium]
MTKNVVFITAVNYPEKIDYAQFCFDTWQAWCEKNNARLFIWDTQKAKTDTMRPTWMRYRMFEILDQQGIHFDRAAMVDADTMVRRDCPNFFNIAANRFCVVRDNRRSRWVKKSIRVYRHLFPGVHLDSNDYFNAGFMIVNREHRPLFKAMLDFYNARDTHLRRLIREHRMGSDQTPLNFIVAKSGYKKKYLPREFNYMHFIPLVFRNRFLAERFPLKNFLKKGYIFHFTGMNKTLNKRFMARTREAMEKNYERTDLSEGIDYHTGL